MCNCASASDSGQAAPVSTWDSRTPALRSPPSSRGPTSRHYCPVAPTQSSTFAIRARREEDLPELARILAAQQPQSRYPFRWPLPFPAREFIVRSSEQKAWVSTRDGEVTGHVSVTSLEQDLLGEGWSAGTGLPHHDLVCLSVLFVDQSLRGTGVGGQLLDTAECWIFDRGLTAVLDVVQQHSSALAVYRHRGWREIGQARPPWLPDDEPPVILMAKGPA